MPSISHDALDLHLWQNRNRKRPTAGGTEFSRSRQAAEHHFDPLTSISGKSGGTVSRLQQLVVRAGTCPAQTSYRAYMRWSTVPASYRSKGVFSSSVLPRF